MKKFLIGLLTIFALAMTVGLVTACSKAEQLITLDQPVIKEYDPDTTRLTWGVVENASSYTVTFTDGNGDHTSTVRTNSASFKTNDEQFSVSIVAESDSIYQSSPAAQASFVKLDSNIQLTVTEDGVVHWDPVPDATSYSVSVNNKVENVLNTEYDKFNAGSSNTIKVKPIREGSDTMFYFSSWSEPLTFRVLGAVKSSSIKYNNSNGKITWDKVTGATSYKVTINGAEEVVETNEYFHDAGDETFEITVQALGDGEKVYNGAVSETKQFVWLDIVENIWVDDGVLSWDEVKGAQHYQLKLTQSGSPINCDSNKYDKQLSAGTQYVVSVMPTASSSNAEYFSNWSQEKRIKILAAPTLRWADVDVDGTEPVNAILWDTKDEAAGYTSKVTGPNGLVEENSNIPAGNTFYTSSFNQEGEYKIQVKSNAGDVDGLYDSAYSGVFTVIRLKAPSIDSRNITSNSELLEKGFSVTFSQVTGATGYTLYKGATKTNITSQGKTGQIQVPMDQIVETDNTDEIEVSFTVQSMGTKVSSNEVRLNSMLTDSNTGSIKVKVLATPKDAKIEGYTYSFTAVDSAQGYNVQVNSGNNHYSNGEVDLSGLIDQGESDVKVCAAGDGHAILASKFTTATHVVRLTAPRNIRVRENVGECMFDFDGDNRALEYRMTVTGIDGYITVTKTDNVRQYITTQGAPIVMYSVYNDYYTDGTYYMTSKASETQRFYRLAAPTGISFTNDYMSWNAPSNIGDAHLTTPTYRILDNRDNTTWEEGFSGTSYSIVDCNPGTYSFRIVALGNGTTCISSDEAMSDEITKLETPNFEINTETDRYEWKGVADATGYVVKIDGVAKDNQDNTGMGTYSYKPEYNDANKTYKVTLQAIGNNGGNNSGGSGRKIVSSKPAEFDQQVSQNSSPEFEYKYSADHYDATNGEITIHITKPTTCPTEYVYNFGSASVQTTAKDTCSFNPQSPGSMDMFVVAKGGGIDDNKVYYTDSDPAYSKTIVLLPKPNEDSSFSVNKDGTITWANVTDTVNYKLKITVTDNVGDTYIIEYTSAGNQTNFNIEGQTGKKDGTGETKTLVYNELKSMTVELQAIGNYQTADTYVSGNKTVVNSQTISKTWENLVHR